MDERLGSDFTGMVEPLDKIPLSVIQVLECSSQKSFAMFVSWMFLRQFATEIVYLHGQFGNYFLPLLVDRWWHASEPRTCTPKI